MAGFETLKASAANILLDRPIRSAGFAALALGALAACGFQPLGLWPLTILALAGLLEIAVRMPSRRKVFLIGWLFGVGHFSVGNNWIAAAFTHQSELPLWLGPIAVVLIAFYLALFPALAACCAWQFVRSVQKPAQNDASARWFGLAFAGFWIITEWLRSWVLTGYAWNPLGIALLGPFDAQGLAFAAPWIGTYGLSGLLVLISAFLRRLIHAGLDALPGRRLALAGGGSACAAVIAAFMLFPAHYLEKREGARPFTLVQPGLTQDRIGDSRYYEANFQKLAALTSPPVPHTRRIVFWPESGLADHLREGYPRYLYRIMNYAADPQAARERIGRVIGPESLVLTGAVDLVIKDGQAVAARNVVTALDADGHLLANYAKAHLVPFGEYVPLRDALEPLGLRRFVAGSLDFWPGPGPRSYDFGVWGKAGVQICYEIVFSGQVVDRNSRPEYIFNPSNDGWFGSWGPPQHLAQARLRAIEEGLPVLRSTTSGISAVIDANGIVRQSIARYREGRLDGAIPPPKRATLFARYGNFLPLALAGVFLLICAVALRRSDG